MEFLKLLPWELSNWGCMVCLSVVCKTVCVLQESECSVKIEASSHLLCVRVFISMSVSVFCSLCCCFENLLFAAALLLRCLFLP